MEWSVTYVLFAYTAFRSHYIIYPHMSVIIVEVKVKFSLCLINELSTPVKTSGAVEI
jgi:hypothetical protein